MGSAKVGKLVLDEVVTYLGKTQIGIATNDYGNLRKRLP